MPQALSGSYEFGGQVLQVATADIAQLYPFEVIPEALVGVEIGGIARQLFQMQALSRPAAAERL